MGRLDIVIPDELEKNLRIEIIKRLGGKKGDMSKAIADAIELWIKVPTDSSIELFNKVLTMSPKDREKFLKSLELK